MAKAKVQLGDKVRDTLTGFTGIATARHEYLTGCNKITIAPQELKDGKPVGTEWFDEQCVEVVQADAYRVDNEKPGGPSDQPRAAACPRP